MGWPEPIDKALRRTPGAVFRRCALHVNPFAYVQRAGTQSQYADEEAYNAAMVAACRQHDISVVGIADHHTVATMTGLWAALTTAGIDVFPGFEVYCNDGVHALALFEPEITERQLERRLGEIGATDPDEQHALANKDLRELLDLGWPAAIIAAHVTRERGVLQQLAGKARIDTWKHPTLLAAAVPCAPHQVYGQGVREILLNKDAEYRREHPVALICANDVSDPEKLGRPNTSTWLKMSEPTVGGLQAAFRDPGSRVRRLDEDAPRPHAELLAAAWTGGFLDGATLHLNSNLNVLIGGRGAGKTTLIESLRFALDLEPVGTAQRSHRQIVTNVLGSGGTVQVLVSSPSPSRAQYLIERTVSRAPVVRDDTGRDTGLAPRDLLPNITVWGQHEIGELDEYPERRSRLVDRFVADDETLRARKTETRKALSKNRERLSTVEDELESARDQLAGFTALEEQQRRYAEAGIEERLREQSQLVREDRLLALAGERLAPMDELDALLGEATRPDRAFLADSAIEELADADLLRQAEGVLATFEATTIPLVEQLRDASRSAAARLEEIRNTLRERRESRQAAFDARLRELEAEHIDGQEFLELQRRLQELLPLRERAKRLEHEHATLLDERESLLDEWRSVRYAEHEALDTAAKQASDRLLGHVRVRVVRNGDATALEQLLRSRVGGRLDSVLNATRKGIDPVELAGWCRQGPEVVAEALGATEHQAQNLCGADEAVLREIEEVDLPPLTIIELNVATTAEPLWRGYDDLSKGQKATAALLLLLLSDDDGADPLIVDQPEDDLDNTFIFQTIVPTMRSEKRNRQFVFASHDPNIPVLGDAELIAEMSTELVDGNIAGRIGAGRRLGSIDVAEVRLAVEENLEGGREAFERRRRMYGF